MTDNENAYSDALASLKDLLQQSEQNQREEAKARQHYEDKARSVQKNLELRNELQRTIDTVYLFPNEQRAASHRPSPQGFGLWADRLMDFGRAFRAANAELLECRLVSRLRNVVDKPLPPAMKFACLLLLLAAEEKREAIANAIETTNTDRELRRFCLWLPFILDNLWAPPTGCEGIIRVSDCPKGVSEVEAQQADSAFGWHDAGEGINALTHVDAQRAVTTPATSVTDKDRGSEGGTSEVNSNENEPPEGSLSAVDIFVELRTFSREKLKGQERIVLEELCKVQQAIPIADLAVMNGVEWDDPFKGFSNLQQRLKPELKKLGWTLSRQNNAATLRRMNT